MDTQQWHFSQSVQRFALIPLKSSNRRFVSCIFQYLFVFFSCVSNHKLATYMVLRFWAYTLSITISHLTGSYTIIYTIAVLGFRASLRLVGDALLAASWRQRKSRSRDLLVVFWTPKERTAEDRVIRNAERPERRTFELPDIGPITILAFQVHCHSAYAWYTIPEISRVKSDSQTSETHWKPCHYSYF